VRVAAVWCATNLSWSDATNLSAAVVRVAKLRELGFDRKLAHMVEDPDLDVRDRVKNALEMMDRTTDDDMKT
jgi:armadillo repeat-containing protein 8